MCGEEKEDDDEIDRSVLLEEEEEASKKGRESKACIGFPTHLPSLAYLPNIPSSLIYLPTSCSCIF